MKITLNELRSLVKQTLRETEEEKGKKGNNKKYPDAEPEKGIKLNLKSSMGDYLEKYSTSQILDVMANYYKGETAKALKSLSSKLRKGLYEGYDKRPAIDENFIELEVNPNGKDFKLFSIIFQNGDFPQSNMGYRNYESIGKKAYFNFSIDEKDELIDMLNQMYDESGDEDIMNWIDDIESYKSEESEEEYY